MRSLVLIAHNLRSTHNVGSLLRTADGLGVTHVYLTGYTPYPSKPADDRLPHIAAKLDRQVAKTALGAENTVPWTQSPDLHPILAALQHDNYQIIGVEQTSTSIPLPDFVPGEKVALIVGREVEGIEPEIIDLCSSVVEIPMLGAKESFNVVQAAAMALYHCRFAA